MSAAHNLFELYEKNSMNPIMLAIVTAVITDFATGIATK